MTSLSTHHSKIEARSWVIECIINLSQFHVTFTTNYSQLVKIVSETKKLSVFINYLENIKILIQKRIA